MTQAAAIGKLREFSSKDSDWAIFKARLEQYFIANNIKDDVVKRAILLNTCDEDAYRLMYSLCVPTSPERKDFKDLISLFDKHFQSTTSAFAARHKFYGSEKNCAESVSDWAARVRNLAAKCEFGNELEVVMRDKFVLGLQNSEVMRRLFEEKITISFEKAVEIANNQVSRHVGLELAVKEECFYQGHAQRSSGARDGHRQGEQYGQRNNQRRQDGAVRSNGPAGPSNRQAQVSDRWENWNVRNVNCQVCGKPGHKKDKCNFRNYFCNFCQLKGHLAKVCKNKSKQNYVVDKNDDCLDNSEEESSANVFNFGSFSDAIVIDVEINKNKFRFHLDTGASVSVISEVFRQKNFSKQMMNRTNKTLASYDGSLLKPSGFIEVDLTFKGETFPIKLYIIPNGGPPLLGRDFFNLFKLSVDSYSEKDFLLNMADTEVAQIRQKLATKFPNVFSSSLGHFTGGKLNLATQEGAKPKFCKARSVPFALCRGVEAEIDRLVAENILSPVPFSEWATPIVPVAKSDGSIRICGDFKITVNPILLVDKYPLPRIEELFAKLQGGVEFTKIDLSHAYQQVELDDVSKEFTTINTHKGLFRYK